MKRVWMVLLLAFFTFSGFLMAFGDENGKREEYQKQAETRLKALKHNLEALKSRSHELSGTAKVQFEDDLRVLKEKEKLAAGRLQRLKAATAKTWDRGRTGVEEAMHDLNRQYEKLEARFKTP